MLSRRRVDSGGGVENRWREHFGVPRNGDEIRRTENDGNKGSEIVSEKINRREVAKEEVKGAFKR